MRFWCWLAVASFLPWVGRGQDGAPPSDWATSRHGKNYIAVRIELPATHEHSAVKLRRGDDPRWADPNYDDRGWANITDRGLPTRAGVFWIRYRVRGDGPLPAGVYQKVCAAFELYWDGKLVGRSGVPGATPDEERPGKLDTAFSIPAEWQPQENRWGKPQPPRGRPGASERGSDEHVIAMRMSTYRAGFPGEWTDLQIAFVDPAKRLAAFSQNAVQPTLAAGAMFMLSAISLLMWLVAARRTTLLLFVGVCLCAAIAQALTMIRFVDSYTYDLHYPVRLATVYLTGALGACLISFVCVHFALPWRRWLLGLFALVFVAIVWVPREVFYRPLSEKSGMIMTAAFVFALVATGWAIWRRQRGGWVAGLGALVSAVTARDFVEGNFSPTFLPILFGLLGAVAVRLREEREAAEQARLAAARLEAELLKKNLQPHFFLNTLTALSEVVERDSRGAVSLIEDLAGEFRALARMSGEKQVPLGQELELCRAHLRVMSVRTGIDCRLETEVDEARPVPPALFLTLIENGFVHQRARNGAAIFTLRETRLTDGIRYTFFSPGEIKPRRQRSDGGTGTRYVKARLDESFAGRWTLRDGIERDGWETVIELRGVPPAARGLRGTVRVRKGGTDAGPTTLPADKPA